LVALNSAILGVLTIAFGAHPFIERAETNESAEQGNDSVTQVSRDSVWQIDAESSRVYIKVYAEGFGHSHGVMGKLRSTSHVLLSGQSEEADRKKESDELFKRVEALDDDLSGLNDSESWRRYLRIAELKQLAATKTKSDKASIAKLRSIFAIFENVNGDPKYRGVAQHAAFQATLAVLRLTLAPNGMLIFDMNSFDADSPDARQAVNVSGQESASDRKKINETMRGPEILDVKRFPDAMYTITSVKPLDAKEPSGPKRYRLEGIFELHGTDRPVEIDVEVEPSKDNAARRMHGQFSIRQTDYGIKPYSTGFGFASVADRLEIWGDLRLVDGQTQTRSERSRSDEPGGRAK
jgi:YceI-like domain